MRSVEEGAEGRKLKRRKQKKSYTQHFNLRFHRAHGGRDGWGNHFLLLEYLYICGQFGTIYTSNKWIHIKLKLRVPYLIYLGSENAEQSAGRFLLRGEPKGICPVGVVSPDADVSNNSRWSELNRSHQTMAPIPIVVHYSELERPFNVAVAQDFHVEDEGIPQRVQNIIQMATAVDRLPSRDA